MRNNLLLLYIQWWRWGWPSLDNIQSIALIMSSLLRRLSNPSDAAAPSFEIRHYTNHLELRLLRYVAQSELEMVPDLMSIMKEMPFEGPKLFITEFLIPQTSYEFVENEHESHRRAISPTIGEMRARGVRGGEWPSEFKTFLPFLRILLCQNWLGPWPNHFIWKTSPDSWGRYVN